MTPVEDRIRQIRERVEKATKGPWRWIRCENGEGSDDVLSLVGSPDDWQSCPHYCFGWPKGGSFRSRGPLQTPGHEHNNAPTIIGGMGWHGSGDLNIDENGADADFLANSRSDIPFLLDQLEEARKQIERLRK